MNSRFSSWFRLHHRTTFRKFSDSWASDELSFASRLWMQYLKLLQERPILTKSLTSGLLSFSADFICQRWEIQRANNKETNVDKANSNTVVSFDWLRASRFTFLGAALVAPVLHVWYGFLARFIPGPLMVDAMKRLLLDQLLFAPAFIPIFFTANLVLEGRPELIKEKIERDLWRTVFTNYAVWIPAQFVNFSVIRPTLQVLFSNFVGFFWNIYFSYAANRGIDSKSMEEVKIVGQQPVVVATEMDLSSTNTLNISKGDEISEISSTQNSNETQSSLERIDNTENVANDVMEDSYISSSVPPNSSNPDESFSNNHENMIESVTDESILDSHNPQVQDESFLNSNDDVSDMNSFEKLVVDNTVDGTDANIHVNVVSGTGNNIEAVEVPQDECCNKNDEDKK